MDYMQQRNEVQAKQNKNKKKYYETIVNESKTDNKKEATWKKNGFKWYSKKNRRIEMRKKMN